MSKRKGIRKEAFMYAERIIGDYHEYPRMIKEKEEELLYPHKASDINQGTGGNLPSSPTENLALNLILDNELQKLKWQYEQLVEVMNRTDEETRQIIEMWYLEKPRQKTWDGVSMAMNISRRQCLRLRDDFVKELAEKLTII